LDEPEFVDFCMSRPSFGLPWPQRTIFFFEPSAESSPSEPPQAASEAAAVATLPLRKLRARWN